MAIKDHFKICIEVDMIHIFDQLQIQTYGINEFVFDIHIIIQHINFISIDNYIERERTQSTFREQTTKIFDVLIERDDMQCQNVYLKKVNEYCKNLVIITTKQNQNIDIKKKYLNRCLE